MVLIGCKLNCELGWAGVLIGFKLKCVAPELGPCCVDRVQT